MSTAQLFLTENLLSGVPLTDTMKQRLSKYLVIAGISYVSIPYINQMLNQTMGTNYSSERPTGNYIMGRNLTSREMKILRLFYSYVFTDDILSTIGVDTAISIENQEIKAGLKSAVKFLVSDPTFSAGETLKDKLVEATGVFVLIATVELLNKVLTKTH